MPEPTNPYAAPQTPLQELPTAFQLPPAKERNFLLQGFVAGLQLGGIASLFITTLGVFTWGKDTTLIGMLGVLVGVIFFSTVIGTMIGGTIQLLALLFGGSPCEAEAHNARQEFDNTGFTPPSLM